MRPSMIIALACLLAALGAIGFLVIAQPPRQGGSEPRGAEGKAADQTELIAALGRASDETRELRLQMVRLEQSLRGEGAASRGVAPTDAGPRWEAQVARIPAEPIRDGATRG